MPPFFSVIIPSYNRAAHIGNTIQSFLDQDEQRFEIIVVDDGSSDNTKAVVEAFTDQRVIYYYKQNGERGAARNYGALKAAGNYITFFDSDDLVYPYFFSHAHRELSRLNMPPCYAQAFEVLSDIPRAYPPAPGRDSEHVTINRRLVSGNLLACNGVFLRRDLLESYRFSELRELSGSEDWVLWLQIAANFPFYYSPDICSCMINHPGRGELNIEFSKLRKRLDALLRIIETDKQIGNFDAPTKRRLKSSAYLFSALKLADFGLSKGKSVFHLLKAFSLDAGILTRRNSYVTIKKLLFSWR